MQQFRPAHAGATRPHTRGNDSEMTTQTSGTDKPRAKAWVYYSVLAGASFIALCTGQLVGLLGMVLFGLYAAYLYRGGRVVIWFW
jgi:hypothetical protein